MATRKIIDSSRTSALAVVARFPLPLFFTLALILCLWTVFDRGSSASSCCGAEEAPNNLNIARQQLGIFCGASFLWTFATALFGERYSRLLGAIFAAVGLIAIAFSFSVPTAISLLTEPASQSWQETSLGYYFASPKALDVRLVYSIAALCILPTLAPFAGRNAGSDAFWQFTHKMVVAAGAGLAGAVMAYLGLTAILATLKLLFDITAPDIFLPKIGIICGYGIAPSICLALTPRDFDELPRHGDAKEFTSRAISLLVKYILVPVASVLSIILAAYIVKIVASGHFSESRLGLKGVIYGCGLVAVALLAYPDRAESRIVRVFWKLWPWLLLSPTVLALLAIIIRVENYGWTRFRCTALLIGLWLAIVTCAALRRRLLGDLRLIPALLSLLLLLSTFGPWSVGDSVGRSQASVIKALLERQGLTRDGLWTVSYQPKWSVYDEATCYLA